MEEKGSAIEPHGCLKLFSDRIQRQSEKREASSTFYNSAEVLNYTDRDRDRGQRQRQELELELETETDCGPAREMATDGGQKERRQTKASGEQ